MKPHAFVAMPFGRKKGPDGKVIDFDIIYRELLEPAAAAAGFEVFRADGEQQAGDIRADMFQELLIADLVIADLTLDNPNVWYELGVRHALRATGVVLVQGPRSGQPFDLYTDRKLTYGLKHGLPDPDTLESDKLRLTAMIRATGEAWHNRMISPVYQLLDHLKEPDWRTLLLNERNEFSNAYAQWRRIVDAARQKNRAGDILVLADEAPTRALWLESRRLAADCLLQLKHYRFALEQYEEALVQAPDDLVCRQRKAVCLERLNRFEEARAWVGDLTKQYPTDPECWALSGRVEKDHWISRWRRADRDPARMREAAALEKQTLIEALQPYEAAFKQDPSDYHSGVSALTLRYLRRHLGGVDDDEDLRDLEGGVRWACLSALHRSPKDYWARVSLAALRLLSEPKAKVVRAFRSAVAAADGNWFALDSSRQTLALLQDLAFRPEEVGAALAIIDQEIARLTAPWQPRKVLLFSGHMVDTADRKEPRFPADKAPTAAARISTVLEKLEAGSEDLALTQGACGGDLLFAEACLRRGVRLHLLQPFEEPEFIHQSVLRGGENWHSRYLAVIKRIGQPPRAAPAELGQPPKSAGAGYAYERCNRWLLYTALAYGIAKVHFICLWNGGGGDGPGGTEHMYNEVRSRTGQVHWVDTRTL